MSLTSSYVQTAEAVTPYDGVEYQETGDYLSVWTNLNRVPGAPDGITAQYLHNDPLTFFNTEPVWCNVNAGKFAIGATSQVDSINAEFTVAYFEGNLVTQYSEYATFQFALWDGTTLYGYALPETAFVAANAPMKTLSITFGANDPSWTGTLPTATELAASKFGVRTQVSADYINGSGSNAYITIDSVRLTVNYSEIPAATGSTAPPTTLQGNPGNTLTQINPKKYKTVNGQIFEEDIYEEKKRIYDATNR